MTFAMYNFQILMFYSRISYVFHLTYEVFVYTGSSTVPKKSQKTKDDI